MQRVYFLIKITNEKKKVNKYGKDFEKISFSCKNSIVINEKVIINSKIHLKSCLRAEKKIHKIIHIILLKT